MLKAILLRCDDSYKSEARLHPEEQEGLTGKLLASAGQRTGLVFDLIKALVHKGTENGLILQRAPRR